jgi:hypothetical protein
MGYDSEYLYSSSFNRLLKLDPEAHFKSKDLLNAMIEDISGKK